MNERLKTITYSAVFTAFIAVCSWITVPLPPPFVPFTMQTFAVFCAAGLLGTKKSLYSIFVYIFLGAVGAPVFSGFKGGLSVLLGTTGGYIIGFIFTALIIGIAVNKFGRKIHVLIFSMLIGLAVCYIFGTAWFMIIYTSTKGAVALGTVLGWCVLPFIIPDILKLSLAVFIISRVNKIKNK